MIIFFYIMTINERFETIIKLLFGGNKRAFALHVGISPTVVENVVGARKGKPSFDVIEKVCANANISAEWLILGQGEIWKDMFEFRKPMRCSSDPAYYENLNNEIPIPEEEELSSEIDFSLFINKIAEQAEEIGKLKERIAQLELQLQKNVSDASTGDIASAG